MTKNVCFINNYNNEAFIRECLDSVFSQTHPFDQVILVDDGSKDGSLEIISEFSEIYPNLMVHQKNNDTDFDFSTQGIQTWVDGDWVRAKGTTLGADNGLGVSMIMAVLAAKDIAHPALEALFTIDEETGMTGANHNYIVFT